MPERDEEVVAGPREFETTDGQWVEELHHVPRTFLFSPVRILDEAHLLNICIHPQNQGRGLGTSALKAVISRAESQGAREMFLEVRASNAAAIGLYGGAGFNETGRRNGYYPTDGGREDAILMAKVLRL